MSRGCGALVEVDCPTPKAHRRLEDAHQLWHDMAASYGNPAAFRGRLNETLAALRGGTWALQQETRGGQDFRAWHDEWHQRIRGDEVLSWLVQAHRKAVAEADLQVSSSAWVTLMAGREGAPLAQFSAPPLLAPEVIPQQLADSRMGPLLRQAAYMVLERQWRAAGLEQWELLQALAHAYQRLTEPLREAHGEPLEDFAGPPDCMGITRGTRTAVFRLKSGRVAGAEADSLDAIPDEPRAALSPAGEQPVDEPEGVGEAEPLRRVAWYFEEARRHLSAEGLYQQRVALFVNGEWLSVRLSPADKQDRYRLWARVAAEVERTRAEAVMTIFETVSHRNGERRDQLVLAGETAGGQHRTCSVSFHRTNGGVQFGRTRVDDDGRRWYFLDPIRKVWQKT